MRESETWIIKETMRHLFLVLLLMTPLLGLRADDGDTIKTADAAHYAVSISANESYLIPKGSHNQRVMHSYGVTYIDARFQWRPGGYNAYDRAYNRPTLEAGLLYGDFSHVKIQDPDAPAPSHVGHEWALFAGMQYDIWRKRRWRAGVNLQNGVAWFSRRYDENNNADNQLVGSPLSVFIDLGAYLSYRLSSRWEVSAGWDFKHVSNGTLERPNLGANTIGATVRVAYNITDDPIEPKGYKDPYKDRSGLRLPERPVYLEFSAGLGANTLTDQFNYYHSNSNTLYVSPFVMLAPMWRYSRIMASGVEMDYIYANYPGHIRKYDELNERYGYKYSHNVLGLGLRHEFFYRHLSLHMGIGWYVYRKMGYSASNSEGNSYQTIGFRYSLPCTQDRLFIGYQVKAHNFSKADCMQMSIGYRLPILKIKGC